MTTLFSFGSHFAVPDPSPFVLKCDLYMRMAGISFDSHGDVGNLRKAPKGKLPFIQDRERTIADSYFIQQHFEQQGDSSLDTWLSEEQKAFSHLIIKSLDENFYWTIVYSRWMRDDTWPLIKAAFFGNMPFPLRQIIPTLARKNVKSALLKQGIGKHSDAEIMQLAKHSLQSLSVLLGDKAYFWGAKPSSLDATAYAFLANVILVDIDNPLTTLARSFCNLVEYCQRVRQEFYVD
jgi:glutathione S-transferase